MHLLNYPQKAAKLLRGFMMNNFKSIAALFIIFSISFIQVAFSSEPQIDYINTKYSVEKTTSEDLLEYEINNAEMINLYAYKFELKPKHFKMQKIAKL